MFAFSPQGKREQEKGERGNQGRGGEEGKGGRREEKAQGREIHRTKGTVIIMKFIHIRQNKRKDAHHSGQHPEGPSEISLKWLTDDRACKAQHQSDSKQPARTLCRHWHWAHGSCQEQACCSQMFCKAQEKKHIPKNVREPSRCSKQPCLVFCKIIRSQVPCCLEGGFPGL